MWLVVQMVTIRTKQRRKGAKPLVDGQTDTAVVVAPREIAADYVKPDDTTAASETRSHGECDTRRFAFDGLSPIGSNFHRRN